MKADILEIAKRRGFFWQASHIHRPVAGFYDYGPIGAVVKRRFEDLWRSFFLALDSNYYELSTSVLMPEDVFKASGHLKSFVDPVLRCAKCGNAERADHIMEEQLKESFEGFTPEKLAEIIRKHKLSCAKCGGRLEEIGTLNMMFPVQAGTGKEARTAYLTPETAQGAYVNFKQCYEVLRKRLPLGLAIIGKAFRNEISPRNALIRMREFTQAELQIFLAPEMLESHKDFDSAENYVLRLFPASERGKGKVIEMKASEAVEKMKLPEFYVYHMAMVQQFYLELIKIPKEKFRFRELVGEEKAFYNKYHWDIEADIESLGGWKEIAGLHYRTDHDLAGHQKVSGQSMEADWNGKRFIPHVLEVSMGVDRNIYALLELFFEEEKERNVIRFPKALSPFDAAVFPLVNKDGIDTLAEKIYKQLHESGLKIFYDDSGSIGRRYRRMDEIGVLHCITVDYDSLKNSDVTVRDRDTMKQERVKIGKLVSVLKGL